MKLKDTLAQLEVERKNLNNRRLIVLPIFIIIPAIAYYLFSSMSGEAPRAAALFGLVFAFIIHSLVISVPFARIKSKLKSALVNEFMLSYHPDIKFQYSTEKDRGKSIINNSKLIRFSTSTEEDVLSGTLKNAQFYISEMRLETGSGDDKKTVFKGIIFELNIPNKRFPLSEIQTNYNVWTNLIGKHKEHKDYNIFYNTTDESAFEETLAPLLPFINHLRKENKSIRVRAEGNKLTIMLENKIRFMDEPSLSTSRSFINKEYNANLARQLNTFLFMVESFVDNLGESEIVEKLELKSLELMERHGLDNDQSA